MNIKETMERFESSFSPDVVIRATRLAALLSKNYMDAIAPIDSKVSGSVEVAYHEKEDNSFLLVTIRSNKFLELPESKRVEIATSVYDKTREELNDYGDLPVISNFSKLLT